MLFNSDFADNTILSCFYPFFVIIDLYFLTVALIKQIFNTIAKLETLIGISTKEAKAEIETHPVIVEIAIRDFQRNSKLYKPFLCFLLINSF